jgi:hypothetical protein
MQNLGTLRQLFLGDLADDGRREERERRERGEREREIMPSLMATLLRWHTHSARTNCDVTETQVYMAFLGYTFLFRYSFFRVKFLSGIHFSDTHYL